MLAHPDNPDPPNLALSVLFYQDNNYFHLEDLLKWNRILELVWLDKKILTNVYNIAKEKNIILQGNLDPNILLNGGKELEDEVKKIMLQFSQNDHIFNLSHGILPTTPIDNVKKTLDIIKNFNEAK